MQTQQNHAETLKQHNAWRRDETGEIDMVRPVDLGAAMDAAIEALSNPTATATNYLVATCHGLAAKSGWWHQKINGEMWDLREIIRNPKSDIDRLLGGALVAQKLCLSHSEISEAMEGHRKGLMDDHLPHRTMFEVELADAVIRMSDLAGAMGLDLGGAIEEKLDYNQRRADHKPENRAMDGGKKF